MDIINKILFENQAIDDYEKDFKNTTGVDISEMPCEEIIFEVFQPEFIKALERAIGAKIADGYDFTDESMKYVFPENKRITKEEFESHLKGDIEKELDSLRPKFGKFFKFSLYEPLDTDFDDYEDMGMCLNFEFTNSEYTENYIEECISEE